MRIDEIEDNIFQFRKTPSHLKARIIVERGQLRDKRLHSLMHIPRLNSIKIDCEELAGDFFNRSLDRFARLGDQFSIFGKETFVLLISRY